MPVSPGSALWAGDNTYVKINALDDGVAVDLNGSSVSLLWSRDGGAEETRPMTITNAPAGQAGYRFQTTELVAGHYRMRSRIIDSSGYRYTSDPWVAEVRE